MRQMPHQYMLPGTDIHAVEEHGGLADVVRKLGKAELGHVAGDHERTYWPRTDWNTCWRVRWLITVKRPMRLPTVRRS
jgi:hypothetical protein